MKKRFKNILTRSPKKNGLLLCICAVCITLISGMLIGCSVINNDSPEESGRTDLENTNPSLEDHSNIQTDSPDDSGTDISGDVQNENMENPSEQTQNENMEDQSEQSLGSEEKSYKSILLGESNFRHRSGLVDESLNISEINQVVSEDEVTARVIKFAVIDLDGDEEEEVVLWIRANSDLDWGFEILHYLNGENDFFRNRVQYK